LRKRLKYSARDRYTVAIAVTASSPPSATPKTSDIDIVFANASGAKSGISNESVLARFVVITKLCKALWSQKTLISSLQGIEGL
jgi:hypothetical protein